MTTNFTSHIVKPPYNLFFLTAILLFLFSFFTRGQTQDFHLNDTYFVVSTIYFTWTLAFIFLLFWIIYNLTKRILWKKYLTWFHVVSTLIVLLLMLTSDLWYKNTAVAYWGKVAPTDYLKEQKKQVGILLFILITLVVGQMAFVINLLVGLIKKLTVRR